jgi:hypothetical protein
VITINGYQLSYTPRNSLISLIHPDFHITEDQRRLHPPGRWAVVVKQPRPTGELETTINKTADLTEIDAEIQQIS